MGLRGLCRFFCHRLFEAFIIVLLILFLPHLPPYTNISEPFSVSPAKPFEGRLALNDKLNNVEIWHKGDFIGPEALADYNGELYVSLLGGDIVKLTNNHITPIVKTGKPCKGNHEERICGRPLGIQFDRNGMLYVADAYYGIYKVNVKSGEKSLLISVDEKVNGKKPKIPNSIALASNGDIYWTDSSSEFHLEDGVFDLLADPSGRLVHFDPKTRQNTVLIDKLHFANGVALSDDEEFVIVAETARNRIHRYYLKGPKTGTRDIFIDGLPGLPDNLKPDGRGGFFVPLIISADADHPSPFQVIGPFPRIRKFVARLFGLTQLIFESINKVYPCEFAQKGTHFVGHFSSTGDLFLPKRTTVLHVDKSGKILDSLHGLNNKINHICDVHIFKDTLYLGSPFNDYIARVPLSKIGWEHLTPDRKKRDAPIEQPRPKPTQAPVTTQRPTTTPPPTTTAKAPPPTTPPPKQTPPVAKPVPTTPPPPKQQTPPPKQQTPPPKQQTPPPTQQTPPPKQQTPPPKQQTPPPKQQTPPPKQQSPPPKQQTPPPKQQQQQTPPKQQTTPPPSKQTLPPATKPQGAPPPPKQETPPTKQQQTPPPPRQQTPSLVQKQEAAPPPPPKQQTPPVAKPANQVPPPTQTLPQKQAPPPVAQPIRDQPRAVPVNNK